MHNNGAVYSSSINNIKIFSEKNETVITRIFLQAINFYKYFIL